MHKTVIHSLLFAMLAALSANVVHEVVVHDQDVCEVCVHMQSHGMGDLPTASVLLDWAVIPHVYQAFEADAVTAALFLSSRNPRAPPALA